MGMGRPTPHGAQNEFDRRVPFPCETQADGNSRLPNEDRAYVVAHADGRDTGAVEELEDVHADEHLGDDDENITLGDDLGARERGVEGGMHEGHVDERV